MYEYFPEHGIFGEERGIQQGYCDEMWIVDPIDGTRSFLSGSPMFGFLLGYLVRGVPEIGIIGMPALNEIFIGEKGGNATYNGENIQVSKKTKLSEAIIYINEGEKIYRDYPEIFDRLTLAGSFVIGIRQLGCVSELSSTPSQ